jgi:YbbR domain-containing protein
LPEEISVDFKTSGLRLALILLNKNLHPLEVDFNTLKSLNRDQNYVLSTSHLDFKKVFRFETQIRHISPDTLYFSEKTGYQKNVPVKVPLYIKCAEGYGYKRPLIHPSFITIWGDSNVVAKVDTLYTQAFTLTNLNKSVNTRLELLRPQSGVYSSVNEVNVSFEVDKLVEQSIVLSLSDVRSASYQKVQMFPSRVRVSFTAIQNAFNPEDTALFRAMIDSEKINRTTNKCPVFLSTVPGNVTVMDVQPKEVEIMIFHKK